jgi:hypothetical protein
MTVVPAGRRYDIAFSFAGETARMSTTLVTACRHHSSSHVGRRRSMLFERARLFCHAMQLVDISSIPAGRIECYT